MFDYANMTDRKLEIEFNKTLVMKVLNDEGEQIFYIDTVASVLQKVQKHCLELDLEFKRTILCGKLMIFIKDFTLTFDEIDDVYLSTPKEVEAYNIGLMSVIEFQLKACFEYISMI